MVSTVFTDHTTIILAAWLNDINNWTYSGTFQGTQVKLPNGLGATPSLTFASETNTGFYRSSAGVIGVAIAGNTPYVFTASTNTGFGVNSDTLPISMGASSDVRLYRDAANVLAQRNGVTGQTLRIYNTFTDAANYERTECRWNSNVFEILNTAAGTGVTTRAMRIGTQGSADLAIRIAGSDRWTFLGVSGHFIANTDNAYDIGASGATRPRSLYWGTQALGPDGTAGNPTFAFANNVDTGIRLQPGTGQMNIVSDGVEILAFQSGAGQAGLRIISPAALTFSTGAVVVSDVVLIRDAAATLAVRDGTNPQLFRVYNTFTDAANYERLNVGWSTNVAFLGTAAAGTGSVRDLVLHGTTISLRDGTGGTTRWAVNSSGHFVAGADNTYDIGAGGATRPRTIYAAANVRVPQSGLWIEDTDASHSLVFNAGSNLTANRTLTLTTGDAARTLTISTDMTFDQGVAVASSPTFAALSLTSNLIVAGATAVQNSQSTSYTLVASDANKHILHPLADNNARTFTIPANASVAYTIGTMLTFVNEINTVTIAINSDTLTFASTGGTGSRTLAASGVATAIKITSTKWIISGTGLT